MSLIITFSRSTSALAEETVIQQHIACFQSWTIPPTANRKRGSVYNKTLKTKNRMYPLVQLSLKIFLTLASWEVGPWSSTKPRAKSLTWLGAIPNINIGWQWRDWEQSYGVALGDAGRQKILNESAPCTCSPESQRYPGPYQRKCVLQVVIEKGFFCCHSGGVPPSAASNSGCTRKYKKMWNCWNRSGGGRQGWSGGCSHSAVKKGWENWLWGDLIAAFP